MSDLEQELVRVGSSLPGPDESATDSARTAFLNEATTRSYPVARRRRRWFPRYRLFVVVAVLLGGGAALAHSLRTSDQALPRRISFTGGYSGTPGPLVVTPGAVWLGASSGSDRHPNGVILRIDPSSLRVLSRTVVLGTPSQIVAGAGAVWVTTVHARHDAGRIVELDPVTGRVVRAVAVGAFPRIAVSDGEVWVANTFYDGSDETRRRNTLLRLDPDSEIVRKVGTVPSSDIAATDGSIWVATMAGTVRLFDAVTGRELGSSKVQPGFDLRLTSGSRTVWVTSGDPNGTQTRRVRLLSRGEAQAGAVRINDVSDEFSAAATTSDLWVSAGGGRFVEVGAHAGAVVRTLKLPAAARPAESVASNGTDVFALGAGRLWRLSSGRPQIVASIPRGLTPMSLVVDRTAAWITASDALNRGHIVRIWTKK